MSRTWIRLGALAAATALLVAACGDSGDSGGARGGGELPECPLDALESAEGTVEIDFWHSLPEENEKALQRITERYNTSQDKVRVNLVVQPSYNETLDKFTGGLSTGDLPALTMLEDTATQTMIDSGAILPAQSCVDADDYDLSQFLPRVTSYYSVDDVLWPMPFNVSNPVLVFNKAIFEQAGLDTDDTPTTLDELRAAAEQIRSSGAMSTPPIAFKIEPWYLEQWTAMAGQPFANNENGRAERATEVTFDNDAGRDVFEWLSQMQEDGLVTPTPSADGNIDNLLAVGTLNAAMTFNTSAFLGTAVKLLEEGNNFASVAPEDLGIGPLPGLPGDGATFVGGGALYLVNKRPPEEQAAAWDYATFLNEPENLAEFAGSSGYIPITQAAADEPLTQEIWTKYPQFKVAYDQLASEPDSEEGRIAASGPVLGDFKRIRQQAVIPAMEAMLQEGLAPDEALQRAADRSDEILAEYNSRVG